MTVAIRLKGSGCMSVLDKFGYPVRVGHRVAYVHRRLNGAPLRLRYGRVIGFLPSDLRLCIKPDHQPINVEYESYHCVVMEHDDPRVTMWLLENG